MLRRLEIARFRTYRTTDLELVRFQPVLGPIGAGKSALLDAISFVADLTRLGPDLAVCGSVRDGIEPRALRPRDLLDGPDSDSFEIALEWDIEPTQRAALAGEFATIRYEIEVAMPGSSDDLAIHTEAVFLKPLDPPRGPLRQGALFETEDERKPTLRARNATPLGWRRIVNKSEKMPRVHLQSETGSWHTTFRFSPDRSVLSQLPDDDEKFPATLALRSALLRGIERVQLSASGLRTPALAAQDLAPARFDGSLLALRLARLERSDPARFVAWLGDVKSALHGMDSARVVERLEDRRRVLVLRGKDGRERSATLASEAVLRTLALTAVAHTADPSNLVLIEDPDAGLDDLALDAVLTAFGRDGAPQVLIASAAPAVERRLKDRDPIFCARDSHGTSRAARALPRMR